MNSKISHKKLFLSIILFFLFSSIVHSNPGSTDYRYEDKIRIKEAVNIFNQFGNEIWKNRGDSASFAILLVTNENEYLMYHSNPSEDFRNIGYDSIVECDVYARPRQFNKNFLATFPAINGIPTIIVGLPENTNRSSIDWIITILHEHFHQLQMSQQDYYSSIDSLDLSGGDNSGMWMLNYKFPYSMEKISDQYKILTQTAKQTFLSINESSFESNLKSYLKERAKFKSMLSKKDYDYFSFQIWQEGIARYTEIKIADIVKNSYRSSAEITQLKDFISLDSFYKEIIDKLLKRADIQTLSEDERNCFYTLGALEGLILDKVNPGWKEKYFKEKFYVEKYF